jgi:hypothetical protein
MGLREPDDRLGQQGRYESLSLGNYSAEADGSITRLSLQARR